MDTTPSKRKADESFDDGPEDRSRDQSSSARKKLKDADSSGIKNPKDDDGKRGPRHIPAPVWGHVLDYMPYEEVRSALLVGKIIANEAVKYVHTLNFTKSCQLDVPSARRFPNVEHVNVGCLLLIQRDADSSSRLLCESTSIRMLPVLSTFSRLKSLFAGGYLCDEGIRFRRCYNPSVCTRPDDHRELFRAMTRSFIGAFQSKLLPRTLESMEGITENICYLRLCRKTKENGTTCSSCRRIISHFPLADLARFPLVRVGECHIDNEAAYFRLLAQQPGAKEFIVKHSTEKLTEFLNDSVKFFHWHDEVDYEDDDEEAESLTKRLQRHGVREWRVQYLPLPSMRRLDAMIDVGFDPKAISKDDLYAHYQIGITDRPHDVFAKATFDALVARGFHFDEADLIVLDETKEPALRGLPSRIKSE